MNTLSREFCITAIRRGKSRRELQQGILQGLAQSQIDQGTGYTEQKQCSYFQFGQPIQLRLVAVQQLAASAGSAELRASRSR